MKPFNNLTGKLFESARLGEAIQPGAYTVAICSGFKGGKQQEAIMAKIPAQAAWSNEKQQSLGKAERSVTSFNWLDRWGCPKGVSIDRYDQSPIDPKGFTLHYPTRSESGEALLPAGFFASFGHANGNEHGGEGKEHS